MAAAEVAASVRAKAARKSKNGTPTIIAPASGIRSLRGQKTAIRHPSRASRSRNQQATLRLYKIIGSNENLLDRDLSHREMAHQLAAVAFSLWRAVFLSDLTGEIADRSADLRKFLQSLIAQNTVLYQTDFASREWTFESYLDNALHRLDGLREQILPTDKKTTVAGSAKERWSNAQTALDIAISNFATALKS